MLLVDLCGVAHSVNELSTIISKATQKEMTKRDLEFVDDSGMGVRLTLWGEEVGYTDRVNCPSSYNGLANLGDFAAGFS